MNLPSAPKQYDQDDQTRTRAALQANDTRVLKTGQDVMLVNSERLFLTSTSALTAHAGGGQTNALKLTKAINHIGTVATATDSVALMPAKAGLRQTVINRGANSAQVFGTTPDTINTVATGTGVAQAAATVVTYYCPVDGSWFA